MATVNLLDLEGATESLDLIDDFRADSLGKISKRRSG